MEFTEDKQRLLCCWAAAEPGALFTQLKQYMLHYVRYILDNSPRVQVPPAAPARRALAHLHLYFYDHIAVSNRILCRP